MPKHLPCLGSAGVVINAGHPLVLLTGRQLAAPPHALIAPAADILGCQVSILDGMPLRCNIGVGGRQGIARAGLPPTTKGAAPEEPRAILYCCLPFMRVLAACFGTQPPDPPLAAKADVVRCQTNVLGRVPLL